MSNKIYLEHLHKTKNGNIDWEHSIGDKFSCTYNDTKYDFIIKDYKYDKNSWVYVFNNDTNQGWISTADIKNCFLGKILNIRVSYFRFKIGDIVNNMKIIAQRKNPKNKAKEYQTICLKCGYDMQNDVVSYISFNGVMKNRWKSESGIMRGSGCPCCTGTIVVPGINDIPTTAPWMIPYFQGGYDEAKCYTKTSGRKIYPKCPDCGRVKNKQITVSHIHNRHSINCACQDRVSYPNKFSYAFLEQLPVQNVDHEYQPDWLKPYYYDNYFEYNGKKYILEMDGGVGHGNNTYHHERDVIGLERDKIKDCLAENHSINVIRIDCLKSDMEYIKNNIFKSVLSKLFDLNNINWDYCNEFATSNLRKEICNYWNNKQEYDTTTDVANMFKCSYGFVKKSLEYGNKYGWCKYNKNEVNNIKSIKTANHALKYITQYNTYSNKKVIYFASIAQVANTNKVDRNNLSKIIKYNKLTRDGYKYYFSTEEEKSLYNNSQDKIVKLFINNHDMYIFETN